MFDEKICVEKPIKKIGIQKFGKKKNGKRKMFDQKHLGGKVDKKKLVKKITSQFWVKIFIAKKSFG